MARVDSKRDLYVKASTTDIVVQLIDLYQSIPPKTSVKISGQILDIGDLSSRLGEKYSKALLGWYSFQGNVGFNFSSRFYWLNFLLGMEGWGSFRGKGVSTQFKFFKKCDSEILDAFSNFGKTTEIPDTIIEQMGRYICLLYGNNYDKSIRGK